MTDQQEQQEQEQEQPTSATEALMLHLAQGFLNSNSSFSGTVTPTSSTNNSSSTEDYITYNSSSDNDDDGYSVELDDYYSNKWLLILPRVAGLISILGVICVAMETWKDMRRQAERQRCDTSSRVTRTTTAKNLSTITHIQFFYQIPLFCHALAFALGTTTAPAGQAWGAIGNIQTCSFQGFLMQFGTYGAVGWDAALSTAYILMVRYKVAEVQLQSYKLYFHLIIWPIALGVSIFPLTQQMYNLNGTVCWVESLPNECVGDECIRGQGAPMWQTIASMLVMLHLMYTVTVMICLYCAIRGLENHTLNDNASERDGSVNTTATRGSRQRRYSRSIGIQGMFYASGMLLTGLPTPVYIVLWNTAGIWSAPYAIFATSILGLLGYVNLVLFLRPRPITNCQTSYAKFLRRAHSWLFDYDYYGWICTKRKQQCHPWCGSHKGTCDEEMNATATNNTPARISSPNPATRGRSRSVSPHNPNKQKRKPLASIREDDALPDEEAMAEEQGEAAGKWTGFLIKVKDQSRQLSQWISELGASQAFSDDSSGYWSETGSQHECGGGDNGSRDNPPSRPSRIMSQVVAEEVPDMAPPCKPIRCQSEVEANNSNNNNNNNNNGCSSCGDTESLSQSARTAPPTMPVRCVSEVEPKNQRNNDNSGRDASPPRIPQRFISEVEQQSSAEFMTSSMIVVESPPHVPQRYISEVEIPPEIPQVQATNHTTTCMQQTPPQIPQRYISEVEQAPDNADIETSPQIPSRYVSELEPTDHDNNECSPPHIPSRYVSEVEPMDDSTERSPPQKPQRYVSEVEVTDDDDEIQSSPPQKPQRYVSEVETPNDDDDDYMPNSPPRAPQRYVSEIEMPDSPRLVAQAPGVYHHFEEQAPPMKPIRYVSEVEMMSESDSSHHHQSPRVRYQPKASWLTDYQGPPCKPLRCESEIETLDESFSNNSNSNHYRNNSTTTANSGGTLYHHQHQRQPPPPGPPTIRLYPPSGNNDNMDTSEGSSSMEGSFHYKQLLVQQSPSRSSPSTGANAAQPIRPSRYPSETEESVSKSHGSSFLMPLDAITEHSLDTLLTAPKRYVSEVELDSCSFAEGDTGSACLIKCYNRQHQQQRQPESNQQLSKLEDHINQLATNSNHSSHPEEISV